MLRPLTVVGPRCAGGVLALLISFATPAWCQEKGSLPEIDPARIDKARQENRQVLEAVDGTGADSRGEEFRRALNQAVTSPRPLLPNTVTTAPGAFQEVLDLAGREGAPPTSLPAQGSQTEIYLFVSFAMPEPTLRSLLRQASAIGAPLVLRGYVQGSLRKTSASVRHLIESAGVASDKAQLLVDPTLFDRFGVEAVPTVVVAESQAEKCTDASACPTPPFHRISGDVALDWALDRIATEVPSLRPALEGRIARLQGARP